MEGRLRQALQRAEEVGRALADPLVARDPAQLKTLGREHTRLAPVVRLAGRLARLQRELVDARELSDESDPELAALARADVTRLEPEVDAVSEELHALLLPQDPHDARDAIVEIRAGTGGDEAAIFAADLYRMYQRFSERHGLSWEPMSLSDGTLGGLKEAIIAVRGEGAFGLLRLESGVHRVQRVPATETQGRIHTSAATVAVLPEAEEVDVNIEDKDLRMDVFRSSGPGGQSVNTTDSAVRITHLPDRARRQPAGSEVAAAEQAQGDGSAARAPARSHDLRAGSGTLAGSRAMVGTGDRSARSAPTTFRRAASPITASNFSVHNLSDVIDGKIDVWSWRCAWRRVRSRMLSDAPPTRRALLAEVAALLAAGGIAEPRREALRLWSDLHGTSAADALVDGDVADESGSADAASSRRRAGALPASRLAHVVGTAGFRTLTLASRPPRTDPAAGDRRTGGPGARAGANRSRRGHRDRERMPGAEPGGRRASTARSARWMSSAAALALAAENRRRRGGAGAPDPRGSVRTAPRTASFDAVVSNPPYLSDAEYAALDPSVRRWEPAAALVSGPDGLDATSRLLRESRRVLRAGGWLALEVDCTRAARVAAAGGRTWAGWTSPFMPTYSDASATCSLGGAHQP